MPEESWSTAKVTWLDREGALEAIRRLAERLLQDRAEVRRIVLFGSLLRGDAVPGSDADIVVIAETEVPAKERHLDYSPYFDSAPVTVDLFILTPAEARDLSQEPSVIATALREGVVLAERTPAD